MLKKHKKIYIILFISFFVITALSSVKAYSIDDVRFVVPYLETDSVWNDIMRNFGQWIFDFIGGFLTYAEEGFTTLMKWDILELKIVKEIMQRFDVVVYSLLFMAFVGVVAVKMFQFQNSAKVLYNVFMSMMIISMITVIFGLLSGAKNDLVLESEKIVKGTSNDTMAVMLYKKNTVDIAQSMKKGNIVHLSDVTDLKLERVNTDLRIKREVLNEYYTYKEDGTEDIGKLDDGWFGFGEERYYRYRSDFFSINITITVSIVIYILAIFKLGYLTWQWLSVNIFGKIGLAKGFWDLNNVGKVLKNAMSTLAGMVVLYFSMMLFSVLSAEILSGNYLGNWLANSALIFSIGMAVIVGSGFVNDFLGIDDGSNFALKSVFMASRLGRMSKQVATTPFKFGGSAIKTLDKGNEVANKVQEHFKRNSDVEGNGIRTDENTQNPKSFNAEKNEDRQKRFQEYYEQKYNDNDERNPRNLNEDDLYKQSRKQDNYNVDLERGNKEGYVSQRTYKPYEPKQEQQRKSMYEDDEMESILNDSEKAKVGKE